MSDLEAVRADVVVVGAGLAGLTAAVQLQRGGLSVVLVEAREQVGGRAHTVLVANERVDIGGQWLGPTQHQILRIVEELGIELEEQEWPGMVDGGVSMAAVAGFGPPETTEEELQDIQRVNDEIVRLQATVSVHAPWEAECAAEWDQLSVDDFLVQQCKTAVSLREWRLMVSSVLAEEPYRVSFLYFLAFLQTNGGVDACDDGPNGAQKYKVKGGVGSVAAGMASWLKEGTIFLCSPVSRIERWNSDEVEVLTPTRKFLARRVVLTCPPIVTDDIVFRPPLPISKADVLRSSPMGVAVKVIAMYSSPFWLDVSPPSQKAPHFSDLGPMTNIFHSKPGRFVGLVGLIVGDRAREFLRLDPLTQRSLVLQQLATVYSSEAALTPIAFTCVDWRKEEFSQGCYAAYAPPGLLTRCGAAIRAPTGCLHWAGTFTSTVWAGYFEGAVVSGQRAATEVLQELSVPPRPRL